MTSKASIFRLDTDSHAALAGLAKVLKRPMNKLVNEAVRDFLMKETQTEQTLKGTLETLRAFRADARQVREASSHYAGMQVPASSFDAEVIAVARQFTRRAAGSFPLKLAVLFGSRARGSHRADSDVDIAVILRGSDGDLVNTSLGLADIAFDLLMESNFYVQPLPIWESMWEHPETHSNPRLLNNIRRDGVVL